MRIANLVCTVVALCLMLAGTLTANAEPLRLATGSPYELGLVDALFDEFKINEGYHNCTAHTYYDYLFFAFIHVNPFYSKSRYC